MLILFSTNGDEALLSARCSPADRQLNFIARLKAGEEKEGIPKFVLLFVFPVSSTGMSELGQLDTYYRIVYDYLQPDRLLSCVEGVLLSVVGVSGHQDQFPQVNNNDDDDSVADRASSFSSGQLWCVVSTVQSRVLLALILYFCLCLIFIHIAWLVYGQHISDLFVRSGKSISH